MYNWLRRPSCCLVTCLGVCFWLGQTCRILNKLCSMLADLLFFADSSRLIAFFYDWTSVILSAYRHFGAISPILTIEYICTIQINTSGINIMNHVIPKLCIVISHSQTVRKVMLLFLVFFMVLIYFLINWFNLRLNIIERPLLRLLHLDHHLLDLFELLKTICLHLFELFLLRNKHVQTSFFLCKKCMLNHFAIFTISLYSKTWFSTLRPTIIKLISRILANCMLALSPFL